MRQTIGRQHGTPAVSSRRGHAVNYRVTRLEWRLIRQLAAARTSCIFMLPASPRRLLSSCAASKRKFTKLGPFLARAFSGTEANESGVSPRKNVSAEALLDDKCAN